MSDGRRNNDNAGRGDAQVSAENGDSTQLLSVVDNTQQCSIFVQTDIVGKIIGRGGAKIKALSSETGARIKVGERSQDDGGLTTEIIISGPASAQEKAKERIIAISEHTPWRGRVYRSTDNRDSNGSEDQESLDIEVCDKTKLLKVDKDWHDILECPVCRDYMSGQIFLCVNGHSICRACKEKTENCSVCRGRFSPGRNFALEQIAAKTSFPCINAEFGCKEAVFINEKIKHEKTCRYRQYKCLSRKSSLCNWEGKRTEILSHIKEKHPKISCTFKEKFSLYYGTFALFAGDFHDTQVIFVFGEIFLYRLFFSSNKESLYISVHYVGPYEDCSKYFYKLHFKNSKYEVLFSTKTHSDTTEIEDLLESAYTCFSLKRGNTRDLIDDSRYLKVEVELIKDC